MNIDFIFRKLIGSFFVFCKKDKAIFLFHQEVQPIRYMINGTILFSNENYHTLSFCINVDTFGQKKVLNIYSIPVHLLQILILQSEIIELLFFSYFLCLISHLQLLISVFFISFLLKYTSLDDWLVSLIFKSKSLIELSTA